ncbi:hypothetical protein PLESTM_000124000 [Pleodorina starrii]|nr:hypothetical protein PLESTM_000124000 [Pleodorina starrii]
MGLDSDAGASQLLLARRGKRQRVDEPSKALARALLETVRQALDDDDDDEDDIDADGTDIDVLTGAVHALARGGGHTGRRAPRHGSFPAAESSSPQRGGSGMADGQQQQYYPDPDEDPIAFVTRVDGAQRQASAAKRGHRKWPPALPGPADESRQAGLLYGVVPPPVFRSAWKHDLAAVGFQPALLDHQEALAVAGAASYQHHQHPYHQHHHQQQQHHPHPHHAGETPSHGSTHTNVETGDAWELGDLGELGDAAGREVAAGGDPTDRDLGVVDRPEQTSTDDGNEGSVQHRKKHGSPKAGIPGGPCAHCGTTESPQWRRPLTKKVVLCNACGIYFSRHHSLPKRKKFAGANAQVASRSGKAAAAPPAKQALPPSASAPVVPSIMCEEELEMDDGKEATPQGALGGAAEPTGAVPANPAHALQAEAQPASQMPWGLRAASTEGLPPRAPQPPRERAALSLPLMTAFPVIGGINAVVQTFLNPNVAGC